jgi:hypothetical protein
MPMDDAAIQKKCEEFLKEIDVPGFILFGRQEDDGSCTVTYSVHKISLKNALLGMLTAVTDLIKRTLP